MEIIKDKRGITNRDSILVIDDEELICNFIKSVLSEKGYFVSTTQDSDIGLEIIKQNTFDVILVDLQMPKIDGLAILERIKQYDFDSVVIMITDCPSFETIKNALRLGVFDYVCKPFDLEELQSTIKRAVAYRRLNLENKKLIRQISEENAALGKKVLDRTKDLHKLYNELQAMYMQTIKAFARAIEAKDRYTHHHSDNVTKYSVMIAKHMGLSQKEIDELKEAGELHDLGKIGINDQILNKETELNPVLCIIWVNLDFALPISA